MNGSLFGAYLVTVTVLILLPGPDMLFAFATGIKSGPRAGFLAAIGAAGGEVVHIGACFVALEILVDGTVGILAGRFSRLLARRRAARTLHVASGSVFISLGAKVALER